MSTSFNTTGNVTDVFAMVSRGGMMELADIEGTNETRLEAAKRLTNSFIETIWEHSGIPFFPPFFSF